MKNYCIDCSKLLKGYYAKRCRICYYKYAKGPDHPAYKGGPKLHYCIDCNKVIHKAAKRCNKCDGIFSRGINSPNWNKNLNRYCIECNKQISPGAIRCQNCNIKILLNQTFRRINYRNISFKSSWEANFAKWLDLSGIKWQYESKRFNLGKTTYTPDFYLPEFDVHIEIKGLWRGTSKRKFKKFRKLYPDTVCWFLPGNGLYSLGIGIRISKKDRELII